MAAIAVNPNTAKDIPQWKKDLIARLRNQNKKSEERLWIDHHPPHHLPLQTHHPHPRTDLVCPMSPENGFGGKDADSPGSSDSEDLHYGPGIVNRLRNKYLSLALRETNTRPTILRKATSLENLLDDDGGDEGEKEDTRLFTRRNASNDGGNRYRSSNRRQEMKRARSVEVISRTNHEEELTVTTSVTDKINNRQSLHEDMLAQNHEEKTLLIENARPYKKPVSIENGTEETVDRYSRRINRPKRIPPLLNEREKPPVDVVKHAKLIFEKRSDTRTKKYHQTGEVAAKINSFNSLIVKTKLASKAPWKSVKHVKPVPNGDVAAKVDCFNDIIVKTKVALKPTKPAIKNSKPVLLHDKSKSNTHHHVRPVGKPVILSEEMAKPKSLEIRSPRQEKKGFSSLPSPIPDVSRVDIKHQDGSDSRNNTLNSLCETPDLILTSSPIPKITSPTYRKRSTENFINEERNGSFLSHIEATNRYISPIHSPTKISSTKPTSLNFNRGGMDSPSIKTMSPIPQHITKTSATSVFNFINSQVDQRHLPAANQKNPTLEHPKSEMNGFNNGNSVKTALSPFEVEKNLKNAVKSAAMDISDRTPTKTDEEEIRTVKDSESASEVIEKKHRKPMDLMPSKIRKLEHVSEKEKVGQNEVWTKDASDSIKGPHNFANSVEKTSSIFENLSKTGKNVPSSFEPTYKINTKTASEPSSSVEQPRNITEEINIIDKIEEKTKSQDVVENKISLDNKRINVEDSTSKDQRVEKIGSAVKPVQSKSASDKNSVVDPSINSEDKPVKIVLPKKPKQKQDESTIAVFNFTSRKDVPDYISNDTSRTPNRPVIPKPDEPGIKLLPEALLSNFKEIQEVWEEDELIRSLEARPPSPCDVTFINDNILIDGKSSLIQQTTKRVKLKISFVDDADIYEYPSETSLLIEESISTTVGSSTQVGHTVPTLSGSSLATYTPKTTEDFQLGVTKSFQEAAVLAKPTTTDTPEEPQSDVLLEEVEKPVLFSSGSTSDILF